EANSSYTFTYAAKIADAAALEAVRQELQTAHDAVDPVFGGDYVISLTNAAVINGEQYGTSSDIRGNVAGDDQPDTLGAFTKTANAPAITLEEEVAGEYASGATLADSI